MYYRGAKGLVLVYDIADLSSFDATAGFLEAIQRSEVMLFSISEAPLNYLRTPRRAAPRRATPRHATPRTYRHAPEDVSVVLVGNKTDLAPKKRLVTEQMGRCVINAHSQT
jgi:GTPase SAR1 family protein